MPLSDNINLRFSDPAHSKKKFPFIMLQHRKLSLQKILCIAAVETSKNSVQLDAMLVLKLKLIVLMPVTE